MMEQKKIPLLNYVENSETLGERERERVHKMCVSLFSLTFVGNIFS
jgi:hypothetical protein